MTDIPLFTMLRGRLDWLNQRQKLIAQNVANVDTPYYTPRDLKPFVVPGQSGVPGVGAGGLAGGGGLAMSEPTQTAAGHMTAAFHHGGSGKLKVRKIADSETTLDQNGVVLEEQMLKMNESRADFETAITFYQKAMGLIRMAARAPGK